MFSLIFGNEVRADDSNKLSSDLTHGHVHRPGRKYEVHGWSIFVSAQSQVEAAALEVALS